MAVDTNVYMGVKKVPKPVAEKAKEKRLLELVTNVSQPKETHHVDKLVKTGNMNKDNKLIWSSMLQEKNCEDAITDEKLNTRNKAKAALDQEVAYMHPEAAQKIVEFAQQGRLCGNCMAFDVSDRAKSCGVDVAAGYGYCTGYDFMCHKDKTCLSHGKGGPKTE